MKGYVGGREGGRVQINREEAPGGWRYMATSRRWWWREGRLEQRWGKPPQASGGHLGDLDPEAGGGGGGGIITSVKWFEENRRWPGRWSEHSTSLRSRRRVYGVEVT